MSFPNDVDNLTNPQPGDTFADSLGIASTTYFSQAQAALVAVETAALQRTSANLVMADAFPTQSEVLISDAQSLTGWAGAGIHDAAVLDPSYFTRGTQSIHVGLLENAATGKYYYNLPTPVSVGGHLYAAIDLRWQHIGGAGGNPIYYQAVAASGTALTGTVATVNLGARPQGVFFTVIVPLGALATIASFGIKCYTISSVAPPAWTHWWIDNLVLKSQSAVETALNSGTQMGVIVPPTVPADTSRRLMDPAEAIVDLRPASAILAGHAGIRHAREWAIPEDGSVDVSADLVGIFNSLPTGTTFQLSPQGKYLCDGTLRLTLTDGTFDGNGATIFSDTQRTANFYTGEEDHLVEIAANGVTLRNLRIVGYRKDAFTGDLLTTVAATPTVVGTTVQLNAINEEVRIPQQLLDTNPVIPIAGRNNPETPYYFRNKDGNIKFEAVLSDTTHVAGDCIFQVVDDDFPTTVLSTGTLTLTGTPTTYTRSFRGDKWQGNRMRVSIKKATATANVITVTSMTAYNTCGYRPNFQYPLVTEFSNGVNISSGSGIKVENCEIEGPDGDGITINSPTVADVTIRNVTVRGSGRHGLGPAVGTDVTIENCVVRESGRAGVDIEPSTVSQQALRLTIRHCHFFNTRNYTIAAGNWARNTNLLLENIESDGAGMGFMYGGSQFGSIHNVTHRTTYRSSADRVANGGPPNADFIYLGRNSHIDGITTELGVMLAAGTNSFNPGTGTVTYTSAGNRITNIKVTAAENDSGALIVDAPKSSIGNASTGIDTQTTPITWAAGAFIGQAKMASDSAFSALDVGTLRSRYPNTYKGLAYSSVWVPGGQNVLDEPLYNVRGISGTTTKPNNLGQVSVAVTPSLPPNTPFPITFPVQTVPAFASMDTPVATTGGTLAAATYFYRVAPRDIYGGPGPALAESVGIAVGGANNAVNLPIRRWAVDGDAQIAGVTIWRGTVSGTYTARYDVNPNAPFYAIQQDVATFKDLGTTLQPPAAGTSTWGYPASVALSANSLVPTDESGYEADGLYGVAIETSWNTTVGVSSKGPDGFTLTFGTAAPAGSPTVSYLIFR